MCVCIVGGEMGGHIIYKRHTTRRRQYIIHITHTLALAHIHRAHVFLVPQTSGRSRAVREHMLALCWVYSVVLVPLRICARTIHFYSTIGEAVRASEGLAYEKCP